MPVSIARGTRVLLDTDVDLVSFRNKTLKTIVLSDGTVLPEGIIVEASLSAVNKDPSLFDDPETFDHLRFCKPQQGAETESATKRQMVTVGLDNLVFGYGRHACPGMQIFQDASGILLLI